MSISVIVGMKTTSIDMRGHYEKMFLLSKILLVFITSKYLVRIIFSKSDIHPTNVMTKTIT